MNAERWAKIDQIYNEALGLEGDRRASFVVEACGSDEKLRREIEALLAVDVSAPSVFLNQPVMRAAPIDATQTSATNIGTGSRMGPYEIGEPLGAGGMGRVFRAFDTRLGRNVALKILNSRFKERGEREARAIASLNHPHVCAIYEAGENYLAMELVDGETLAARLKRGPLRLEEVVRFGAQMADALAAAHSRGLIHRDLKPANIMLTKAGVKVLDFGLARFTEEAGEPLTQEGAVMGTPGYMPPEQMEGRLCDQRTDIYALGLILSEMATGKRGLPDEKNLQPPALAHVVERCTAREPDERWQSARDVKAELEWVLKAPVPQGNQKSVGSKRTLLTSIGAGVAIVTALAFGFSRFVTRFNPPHVARLAIALPEQGITSDPGNLAGPAVISPDGEIVVLQLGSGAQQELWVRRFDSNQFERLPGTVGARTPFWSPDGKQIAFFAGDKLQKISIHGGPAETICSVASTDSRGGAWSSNGAILYGVNFVGLMRVSDHGGEPELLLGVDQKLGENSIRFPQFLEDGNRFIYYSRTNDAANHGIYLDSLQSARKRPRRKLAVADGPALIGHDPYSKHDFLVYPNDKSVWTQAFDLENDRLSNEKVAISDDVGPFSLSRTGTLVFRRASATTEALTWMDRNGRALSTVGQPGDFWDLKISPDQHKVAVLRHRSSDGSFWIEVIDLVRNLTTPLSNPSLQSAGLAWARDSERLFFASWSRDAAAKPLVRRLYEKAVDQAGDGDLLSESQERFVPEDVSPDGSHLVGERQLGAPTLQKGSALAMTAVKPVNWKESVTNQTGNFLAQFSPDGRWIAYQSVASGSFEIYLSDFPEGRSHRQISVAGGTEPRWSVDSKELFYMAADSTIWSAGTLASLTAGGQPPVKLFSAPAPPGTSYFLYDVARDGQRFLVVNGKPNASSQELRVIFNWPELVRDVRRN